MTARKQCLVRIRTFKGTANLMTRVRIIDGMLPQKPVDPVSGKVLDYHSHQYGYIDELIGICHKIFGAAKKEVADRDADNLKLTEELYEMTRKHARLKESNKLLREEIRKAA